MKVTVRFFASYRERTGKRSMSVTLADKATVGDLVTYVSKNYPGFAPHPGRVVVAVNEEYVSHSQRLKDGDEAAFIPPVSGGSLSSPGVVQKLQSFDLNVGSCGMYRRVQPFLTGDAGGVPQPYFLPLPTPRKGQGDGRMPKGRGEV